MKLPMTATFYVPSNRTSNDALANHMLANGQMEPITVLDMPFLGYLIINGVARYLAAKEFGWESIEAHVIRDWDPKTAFQYEVHLSTPAHQEMDDPHPMGVFIDDLACSVCCEPESKCKCRHTAD